jgi:zinc finger BED domain-containing protein 5/7/8/9
LSNESLVPNKLKRHLETNHAAQKDKPSEYFEKLAVERKQQSEKLASFTKLPEKGLIASYKVAQLLAKRKKAHTEAESIIAPALAIIVETMLGSDAAAKVKKVPLSNDTISRRIMDISSDLQDQIGDHFKTSEIKLWALQVDESTDISGKAQLLAFIRFIKDGKFVNEFLFCRSLTGTTKGNDIYNMVNENLSIFKLSWKNCVSICTDGCPSMQGKNKGFVTLARQQNPNIVSVHCMIHRESLASKSLPKDLQSIMDQVVQVVNFIKSRPLQSRLFAQLCEAMDSDYKCLLYHTEIRWLSKGKVLNRLVHLKVEVISFLEIEDQDFGFQLHDEIWWLKVQFLSDLFGKLNSLNLSLQGPSENIITSSSKLKSFNEKLSLWKSKISKGIFDCFPTVNESQHENKIGNEILNTLSDLQSSLQHYFPSLNIDEFAWVINPFAISEEVNLSTEEEEQLIELRNDKFHQTTFTNTTLEEFWLAVMKVYPLISLKAVNTLLPFSSSWFCEFGFSALTEIKSKKRERLLRIDDEMRVCLSTLEPRWNMICSLKQAQPSH